MTSSLAEIEFVSLEIPCEGRPRKAGLDRRRSPYFLARRNQHALSAATAPRRPCCSLYSARARSGFEVKCSRVALPSELRLTAFRSPLLQTEAPGSTRTICARTASLIVNLSGPQKRIRLWSCA